MQIFFSWSGERGRTIAEQLSEHLRQLSSTITPWMAPVDIRLGTLWWKAVHEALRTCSLGLLCVTRESVSSAWMVYEAGAIARSMDGESRLVIPVLFDVMPQELPEPLHGFHGVTLDKSGWHRLVLAICALTSDSRSAVELSRVAGLLWNQLAPALDSLRLQPAGHSHVIDPIEGLWADFFLGRDEAVHVSLLRINGSGPATVVAGTEYDQALREKENWTSTAVGRGEDHLHYMFRSHSYSLDPVQGMTDLVFTDLGKVGNNRLYRRYRGYFINAQKVHGYLSIEHGELRGQRVGDDVRAHFGDDEQRIAEWYRSEVLRKWR